MECLHLKTAVNDIETDVEAIVRAWVNSTLAAEKFKANRINRKFFARHFGIRVIGHLVNVINGSVKPGECPVMTVLLMFFREKNIPLSDIFIICSSLREQFVEYFMDRDALSKELYREISFLIDKNFEGVVREYFDICVAPDANNPDVTTFTCNTERHAVSRKEETVESEKMSAEQFWVDNDVIGDDVEELRELAIDVEQTIHMDESLRKDDYEKVRIYFGQYTRIVNEFYEFRKLGYSLTILSDLLENTPYENIPEADNLKVQTYIESIMEDLSSWCRNVFIEQNTHDVHYLDDSLLASIAMLEVLLTNQSTEDEELELF